jgi:hypothetical protein
MPYYAGGEGKSIRANALSPFQKVNQNGHQLADTKDGPGVFRFFFYWFLSQFATARGSNRTQVPIRNDGILPAAACLKIVTFDTESNFARSSAVRACPIFSIWSAIDISCLVIRISSAVFWGLAMRVAVLSLSSKPIGSRRMSLANNGRRFLQQRRNLGTLGLVDAASLSCKRTEFA